MRASKRKHLLSMPYICTLTFVFGLLFSPITISKALTLNEHSNKVPLAPYTAFICIDHTLNSVADAVNLPFNPPTTSQLNLGIISGECWLRFSLHNNTNTAAEYFIQVPFGWIDYIDLYLPEANGFAHAIMGDQYNFQSRDLRVPVHTALIHLQASETKTFYIRAKTYNTMALPLNISSLRPFIETSQYDQWISGLFYGFLCGLIVFGIYIFAYFKEIAYIHYAIHIITVFFIFLGLDGHNMRFWQTATHWQDLSISFFCYGAILSGLTFGNYYLNIEGLKRLKTISYSLFTAASISLVLLFFIPLTISLIIMIILAVLTITLLLTLSYIQLKAGLDSSKYYTIGWGFFLVMALALVSSTLGLISMEIDPLLGVKLAFIAQQFLLAIGIGKRIKQLQFEQQRAESKAILAEAENRAKSDFLAKMSHEIRTPMNAVLGILQVLRGSPMDDETKALMRTAHHSGKGLMNIINDILDYSKIEAGMLKLENIPFDLKQLISECGQLYSIPAEQKGIELVWSITQELPQYIKSDPTRLRQIINNLLSNSLKFTAKGKIEIIVKLDKMLTSNRHRLCFEIKDSGIGISKDNLSKLFHSFQQADTSTTRKYGGTGLGLTICKQLVELMGGTISVESIEGLGTLFRFTVVCGIASQEELVDENEITCKDLPDLSACRVLIAEDNPVNMLVITRLLQKTGINMVVAEDGQKAVTLFQDQPRPFDLILMDCEMPVMDGFAASKAIRDLEAANGTKQIPIIALTAHATDDIKERCTNVGMNDYLPKPIEIDELNVILNKWAI